MSSLAVGDAAPLAGEIAARIDTLVVDEAHHVGAAGWADFREAFAARKILQGLQPLPFAEMENSSMAKSSSITHYASRSRMAILRKSLSSQFTR